MTQLIREQRAECRALLAQVPDAGLEEARAILGELVQFYTEERPQLMTPPKPEYKHVRIAGRYTRPVFMIPDED